MMKRIRWRGLDRDSLEYMVFRPVPSGFRAEAVIVDAEYGLSYTIDLNENWTFRRLDLAMTGEDRELALHYDGRTWTNGAGTALPYLDAAREIDISISPITNTLPVRRLGLAVGESAEIVTAYIEFPTLNVIADPQRYTRLSEDRYEYKSLDSDFLREIIVDEDGFVIEYPDLFTRL
jgi:hypothetical protein